MTALLAAVLAGAAAAAPAAAPKKAAAPALATVRGKVIKAEKGRLTLVDDAGHLEQYLVDARTKTTCDGKKSSVEKAAPGACERVVKALYESATKRVATLELRSALKADADDAKSRPTVTGEVAVTDVLAGKLTVRMGGGANIEFKVVDGTKIVREAAGAPAQPVGLETLKVGDRVEVRSKDWKTADEIHAGPAR